MKLALLSDLHLSVPGRGCPFTPPMDLFLSLWDEIAASHDLMILAGDVYDHDAGTHLYARRACLEATRAAWPRLEARLAAPEVLSVYGNHDAALAREGVPGVLELELAGWRLLVVHGHQLHAGWRLWEEVKYPIKWAAAFEQRWGSGWVGEALYAVNEVVEGRGEVGDNDVDQAAKALLRRSGADAVICGHSHHPRAERVGTGLYLNAGACSFGRLDWISLELPSGHVTVHDERGRL